MIFDFEPGDKVVNPNNKEWGVGQIQSIIKEKITVNFESKIPIEKIILFFGIEKVKEKLLLYLND